MEIQAKDVFIASLLNSQMITWHGHEIEGFLGQGYDEDLRQRVYNHCALSEYAELFLALFSDRASISTQRPQCH